MNLTETPLLSQYQYELPEDRIAKHPLEHRDGAKLLHYEGGIISHCQFKQLPELLPKNTMLVFNDTKVIPARLLFRKSTGARIEIFLLRPIWPSKDVQQIMGSTGPVVMEAMIGNLKKWSSQEKLELGVFIGNRQLMVRAELVDRENRWVKMTWDDDSLPFVDLVEAMGEVPLPPYLNRKVTEMDRPRYQTVYSKEAGAVAAPTAGLHFSHEVLQEIQNKGLLTENLTLHVSAGTFQPIKEESVVNHPMHSEQMVIQRETIANLLKHEGNIVAVGTTSMRTLESLFWFGVKLIHQDETFHIEKLFPYENHLSLPSKSESFAAILTYMEKEKLMQLSGTTEIMIMPGYTFSVCNGLVTNFHQPGSTLILLVAAFTDNNWRSLYQEALREKYRFLSYGDSNLIWHRKI